MRAAFAKAGELYLVYLPNRGTSDLDLTGSLGTFSINWFDPRNGGTPKGGSVQSVLGVVGGTWRAAREFH